jgi:hypothetical protein
MILIGIIGLFLLAALVAAATAAKAYARGKSKDAANTVN